MLLIIRGISCSGKSTLCANYGKEAIVSSDAVRKEIIGTYNVHPSLSSVIWKEVNRRIETRLEQRMVTILDATNISLKTINKYKKIGQKYDVPVKVVSLIPDVKVAHQRASMRRSGIKEGVKIPDEEITRQFERYENETPKVKRVFDHDFYEGNYEDCKFFIDQMIIQNNRHVTFDDVYVIGDIHGCIDELKEALSMIPENALVYSTGDIIDRGVDSMGCIFTLMEDPRFCGFTMGNHENAFLMELGGRRCNSSARKRTHEEFKSLSSADQERVVEFLNTGKPFIIIENPDRQEKILLTHAGVGEFDALNMSIFQCCADKVNPVSSDGINSVDEVDFQFHGHMHWAYTGDFSGTVLNIDSGVCYGEHLTAINAFNKDVIIKVDAYA